MNYGVVFEPPAKLQLSQENWIHTFEIQLPEDISMIQLSGCTRDVNTCSIVNAILLEINQIRQETALVLNHTIDTIKNLVPEKEQMINGRTTRALLPFVGDLSKSLFGTATFEDVQLLARHINSLNKLTRNVVKSVQQHEDNMSSYMKTVDDRITNIMKGIKENEMAITHIQSQLFESFENLERSFTTMGVLLTKQIEKSRKLETRFQELIQGVYELVEGKLSPHLVSPTTLSNSIKDIQSIINNKFQGFHLILTDPKDIYKKAHTFYTRNGTKLFISVKFPMSPFAEPLTMFKILTFPVPINETSNHATHLVDLPEILAVTSNLAYYTTLNAQDLIKCSRTKIVTCSFTQVLKPFTYNSCELALFKNDKTLIKSLCNFRVSLDHVQPQVKEISDSAILVYKTKILEFDCQSGRKTVTGCDFCILSRQCKCAISTSDMYLPPRLSKCHEDTTSKVHPVNLALLQQFFNDTSLKNVDGNTLFENPLKVETPVFKIYNHTMSSIIADDRQAHLSLQKMAKAASDEAVVFKSMTDPILSGDISLDEGWPSRDDILLYITTAIAAFSLVAFVLTYLKLRKVLVIISVLQNAQKIEASTLPSFIYQNDKTTAQPPKFFLSGADVTIEHYILAICMCILLLTISMAVYTIKCKSKRIILLAEVTNGESCEHIPLRTLTVCPNYWEMKSPAEVLSVTIRGKLSPTIEFDWDQFEMKNKLTNRTIYINKIRSISMLKGRRLRKLLHSTYSVHFFIQHESLLLPIS